MVVQPHQSVRVAWVPVEQCVLGSRVRMTPEAVEKKWRQMLQVGDAQMWPPCVGHWRDDGRFSVDDGRHEFVAATMHGRSEILVCWLVDRSSVDG